MRKELPVETRAAILKPLAGMHADFLRSQPRESRNRHPRKVALILLDHFSMSSVSVLFDALVAVNLIHEKQYYEPQTYGLRSHTALSDLAVEIPTDGELAELKVEPGMLLVVCGGARNRLQDQPELCQKLKAAARSGAILGGLWNGAYYLAASDTLAGHSLIINDDDTEWSTKLTSNPISQSGYAVDNQCFSCADTESAHAMLMQLIANLHDEATASAVDSILHERCIDESPINNSRRLLSQPQVPDVLKEAIQLMESNIDDPLSIDELAGFIGISRRQIERLFHRHIGATPSRFYMQFRLTRAHQLLQQSGLSVSEISSACGFVSATHFSRSYRRFFGQPPISTRRVAAVAA